MVSFFFSNYITVDNDDDWNFTTKLSELPEANDESGFETLDSDIFRVKFIGKAQIDSPKSEEATATAIKAIISSAKCKYISRLLLFICTNQK